MSLKSWVFSCKNSGERSGFVIDKQVIFSLELPSILQCPLGTSVAPLPRTPERHPLVAVAVRWYKPFIRTLTQPQNMHDTEVYVCAYTTSTPTWISLSSNTALRLVTTISPDSTARKRNRLACSMHTGMATHTAVVCEDLPSIAFLSKCIK